MRIVYFQFSYVYINTIDTLQWGLFLLKNYILVTAALNDGFSVCEWSVISRGWVTQGGGRCGVGKDGCGWGMLVQMTSLRLERRSVAFLVVYMWVGLRCSVDQGVYVDLG